jgi:hypothetical protein
MHGWLRTSKRTLDSSIGYWRKVMSYICVACAKKKKLKWPNGHLANFHLGTCPHCKKKKGLCSIYDYNGDHMKGKNIAEVRD